MDTYFKVRVLETRCQLMIIFLDYTQGIPLSAEGFFEGLPLRFPKLIQASKFRKQSL